MTDYMNELRAMWDDALSEAVRNRANKNAAENGDGAIRFGRSIHCANFRMARSSLTFRLTKKYSTDLPQTKCQLKHAN